MDPLHPSSRREVGRTGIRISPLGFGASPLGNEFGPINESQGIAAVHAAIQNNVNYFDVSPYYGKTLAETVLGKALSTIPRHSFVLSTKVGRYDTDVFDFSAKRVRESLQQSMRRLCVDYVDIVFVHDAEFGDLDQVVNETIPELVKMKKEGIVKAIGISGYPLEMFTYVVTLLPTDIDVILSYCNYTLQNERLVTLLPALRRLNIGTINASPLSMGLLTQRGPPSWHPADDATKAAARSAAKVAGGFGRDVSDIAMEFALAGGFDTTLVGIDSVETLNKNLNVLKAGRSGVGVKEVRECFDDVRGRRWESGYFKAFP